MFKLSEFNVHFKLTPVGPLKENKSRAKIGSFVRCVRDDYVDYATEGKYYTIVEFSGLYNGIRIKDDTETLGWECNAGFDLMEVIHVTLSTSAPDAGEGEYILTFSPTEIKNGIDVGLGSLIMGKMHTTRAGEIFTTLELSWVGPVLCQVKVQDNDGHQFWADYDNFILLVPVAENAPPEPVSQAVCKTRPLNISFFLPPRAITGIDQVKEGDFLKCVTDEHENFTLGAFYIAQDTDRLDPVLNIKVENDNGKREWRSLKDFELVSAREISNYICFYHDGQKNALTDTAGAIRLVETKEITNLSQVHIGDMLMCNDMMYNFTLGKIYTVSMIDYQNSGLNLRIIDDDGTHNWADLDAFERVMLCDDVAPEEQPMPTDVIDDGGVSASEFGLMTSDCHDTDGETLMLMLSSKDPGLSIVVNIPVKDTIKACRDILQFINENMMEGK